MMLGIIKCSIIFGVFIITDVVQSKKHAPRIMKGTYVDIEQHPYMIALLHNNGFICGGSIVTDRWILTAAHCCGDYDPKKPLKYKIAVGGTKVADGTRYEVVRVIVHPNYDGKTHLGDISMMKIKDPIQFGPKVQKIRIAMIEKRSEDYKNCVTAGWGSTDAEDADHLQELELSALALDNCEPYKPFRSNVCVQAVKEEAAPCFGDSGGPLICDGIQVGLLSYGSAKCDRQQPEVYTAVAAYYAWIRKILRFSDLLRPWTGSIISNVTNTIVRPVLDILKIK